MPNLDKFENLKKQIRQAEFELEMLKKDPGTSHEEMSELDALLSKWKLEYADRVAKAKMEI